MERYKTIELIKLAVEQLKKECSDNPSRVKSIALTHLQESYLWLTNQDNEVLNK